MPTQVRLFDDERLDIPDARALQDLPLDALSRALGGMMGPGAGVMSLPDFTVTSDASSVTFTINAEVLVYTWQDDGASSKDKSGRLLILDPTLVQQPSQLALNGLIDNDFYIWAREETVDDSFDTRRKWDSFLQAEVSVGDEATRTTAFVGIAAAATQPPAAGGREWQKIAFGTNWFDPGGGFKKRPVIFWLSPWDTDVVTDPAGSVARPGSLLGVVSHVGASRLFTQIVGRIAAILSTAADESWWAGTIARGLKQINALLDTHDADIAAIQADRTDRTVLAAGQVIYNGGTLYSVSSNTVGSLSIFDVDQEGHLTLKVQGKVRSVNVSRQRGTILLPAAGGVDYSNDGPFPDQHTLDYELSDVVFIVLGSTVTSYFSVTSYKASDLSALGTSFFVTCVGTPNP